WDYFYDEIGKNLVRLTRKLVSLRKRCAEFRHGEHYFFNDDARYLSRGLLLFVRKTDAATSLIAVNFTDAAQNVPFKFEHGGNYHEQLHEVDNFVIGDGRERLLTIPSNYGRIWRSA